MSFEAVPCMIRSSSGEGSQQFIGLIIRPSSSQDGSGRPIVCSGISTVVSSSTPTTSSCTTIQSPQSATPSKRSFRLSSQRVPKVLLPSAQLRLSCPTPSPLSWSLPSIPVSSNQPISPQCPTGVPEVSSTSSPLPPHRPSSGTQGLLTSSPLPPHRPSSGTQGLLTSFSPHSPDSPPQVIEASSTTTLQTDVEEDLDEMPRLWPIDHEEPTSSKADTSPFIAPNLDDGGYVHSSECETSIPPSISISTDMQPSEIIQHLTTAFGSEKMRIVAKEMIKSRLDDSKNVINRRKANSTKKTKESHSNVSSYQSGQPLKNEKDIKCQNELTRKERRMSEERRSEEEPRDVTNELLQFRLAVKRQLTAKIDEAASKTFLVSLPKLLIDRRTQKKSIGPFNIDWTKVSNEKCHLDDAVKELKENKVRAGRIFMRRDMYEWMRRDMDEWRNGTERKRKGESIRNCASQPAKKLKKRGGDTMDEGDVFTSINTNRLHSSSAPLPHLYSPLHCSCIRGGCSSTSECISRSTRSFCSTYCTLSTCTNRLGETSLYFSKGVLRTRTPRKANEFLCEYTGEVVGCNEMKDRIRRRMIEGQPLPRALPLTPNHFIDATQYGSIARYVKHSCTPNSVIQVWNSDGCPRLCIFSRFPLATDAEITVNLSHLTLLPFTCHCNNRRCIRRVPPCHTPTIHPFHSTLFLQRNLRVHKGPLSRNQSPNGQLGIVCDAIELRTRRADGSCPRQMVHFISLLRKAARLQNGQLLIEVLNEMEDGSSDANESHALACIRKWVEGDQREVKEKKRKKGQEVADISYLDNKGEPVGSYSPDEWPENEKENEDAVRCVCGVLEEEGEMIECDKCHYWLHIDCVDAPSGDFVCPLCSSNRRTPFGNVILRPQPDVQWRGCTYYKALGSTNGLQVRLNECVYVRKLKGDQHKKILRALEQGKKIEGRMDGEDEMAESLIVRSELRVFRVERLFLTPGGLPFLFGFYYARPHETYSDGHRYFHPNEVFSTPLYDTLPLSAVHGKCIVMEPSVYLSGRPLFPQYREEDVLVCEFHMDRNQRSFEKNRHVYFINTQPYAFRKFENPRSLQRYFTPFTSSPHSSPQSGSTTCSPETIETILRKESTRRIDRIAKRLTSSNE